MLRWSPESPRLNITTSNSSCNLFKTFCNSIPSAADNPIAYTLCFRAAQNQDWLFQRHGSNAMIPGIIGTKLYTDIMSVTSPE